MGGGEQVRAANRVRILTSIAAAGTTTRVDLARGTGLTRPTVSALVAELMADGWVYELGPGASSGGRRPILIAFNPAARLVVGAELSAGHVRTVLSDLGGTVLARGKRRTGPLAAAAALDLIGDEVADLLRQVPPGARIAGLGVGLTGAVDGSRGIWGYSPHYPGEALPVAERLAVRLGLPVLIENDARCLALGEYHYGERRRVSHLVAVRIGIGIGAGILVEGRPFVGSGHGAGEFGHTVVSGTCSLCTCGRYGCLETVAAAGAIAQRAVAAIMGGRPSLLTAMAGDGLDGILASDVIAAAHRGDGLAQEVLAEAGRQIGAAVGNLINVLNPELVVIGGGTSLAGEYMLGPLREVALARALPVVNNRTRIRLATFGEYGVSLGAAALVAATLLPPPPASPAPDWGGKHESEGCT